MEAPKIALRPDEKVSIPVMEDVDRNLGRRGKTMETLAHLLISAQRMQSFWIERESRSLSP